jgi:hypothetical protein
LATVSRDNRASIGIINSASDRDDSVLNDEKHSYFLQSVCSTDSKILVLERDLGSHADSLATLDWPSRQLHTLRTFPAGRPVYNANYSTDGRHILAFSDGVLVMMDANGENMVGVSAAAPTTERSVPPLVCGSVMKSRRGFLSVGRHYAAYVHGSESISVVDIQRGDIHEVSFPGIQLRRVFIAD